MKKFYLLLVAMFVAIAANAVDFYLIGGFNGWATKQASCKFTDQGDGTYVLHYNGTLTSGFKINDGSWSNDNYNFGGSAKLKIGVLYNLTVGGSSGNITMDDNIDNPVLTFNPTAKTLLIEGESVAAEYSYSVHGSAFTGNESNWVTKNMTEKDGKWILEEVTVVGGSFGIRKDDKATGKQVDWISSAGAAAVVLDTPMAAKIEGTNWSLTTAGTYTFSFDPEAMKLTVTKVGGDEPLPTPSTLYWSGDLTGGTWEFNNEMEGTDGVFTATIETTRASYITFSTGKIVNWNVEDGLRYGATSKDLTVVSGTEYDMSVGSDNCWVLTPGKYTATVDLNTLKVKFVKDGGEDPEPTTIYWSGDLTGTWAFNNEMTGTDGVYTANFDVTAANGYITITTGVMTDWAVEGGVRYGATEADLAVESGTAYNMVISDFNCWKLARAKYSMTVDMNAMTVTFVKTGEIEGPIEPTDLTLYVVGTFCGWEPTDGIEMEKAGNVYTATLGSVDEETEFKITTADWATNFGAGENNVAEGVEIDAWFDSQANFVLTPEEGTALNDVKITFTLVEGSAEAGTSTPAKIQVSWTTTGVEAIAADANTEAVYYNMQGVKVANPTNGLYIKVAGNKAVKVVL